jgi:hypothetical protein
MSKIIITLFWTYVKIVSVRVSIVAHIFYVVLALAQFCLHLTGRRGNHMVIIVYQKESKGINLSLTKRLPAQKISLLPAGIGREERFSTV